MGLLVLKMAYELHDEEIMRTLEGMDPDDREIIMDNVIENCVDGDSVDDPD